jgi:hypothetical protein
MQMRILKYCLLLLLLPNVALFGQDVTFHVQFHNQRVYYPGTSVWVRATVRNNSDQDYVFSLADQAEFNLLMNVRTLANQAVPVSENYMLRAASSRPVFYRLLKLLPGEEHSFLVDLGDFVRIDEPGNFIVQAQFVPSVNNAQPLLRSNILRLSVRPDSGSAQFIDSIDAQTGEILERQGLAPDEVIRFILDGRQRGHWNRVFLYLDLDALFQRSSDRRIRFLNASETTRNQLLQDFGADIRAGRVESSVATAPDEFSILQVSYTPSHATVVSRHVYYRHQFNEIKEFIWNLELNNGVWLVTGFAVQNLGTQ